MANTLARHRLRNGARARSPGRKKVRLEPSKEYFSRNLLEGSRRSAEETIPLVLRLIQPRSVIDVGCGVGSWLAVCKELGVTDVLGVDGSWADKKKLEIPEDQFRVFDLREPLRLQRRFDLVLSLEVAQHLPSNCAEAFVSSLTRLGPVVLFSAAIPHQGGIGHVNEQWPEYWASYFEKRGYVPIDCIRPRIWQSQSVEWWFAQNTLLFARRRYLASHAALRKEHKRTECSQLSLVHPRKYLQVAESFSRLCRTAEEIAALVPPLDDFILVDEGELQDVIAAGRRALPFLERDGQYWGNPEDDLTAIRELERMRCSGVNFLVFAWPAFWWLDHYAQFRHYLRSEFRCALANDRLVAFDLRSCKHKKRRPADGR